MFLGSISQTTSVANTNIPITTTLSTNRKVVNNSTSNVLELRKAGIYNVDGWITMTGATGTIDVNILADGVVKNAISTTLTASTQYVTIPLTDAIKAVVANYPEVADISLQVDTAGLTLTGLIRVEYLQ